MQSNKRHFQRAERMKDAHGQPENQLLNNFTDKYAFPLGLGQDLDSSRNGGFSESSEDGRSTHGFGSLLEKKSTANGQDDQRRASVLEKFRRAGMKAKLVQRMEKIIEDRLTAKQVFSRYVQSSTLHGFRFIFTKTFYIRRFAWLVVTLTMAGLFLKELRDSINLYYTYPFSTTSTVEYVNKIKFPAISICNLNEFRYSAIMNSELQSHYKELNVSLQKDWRVPKKDIPGPKFADIMTHASHKIDTMLLGCEWIARNSAQGRPNLCTPANFTSFQHYYGQTCYTFNSGMAGHQLLELNETGLNHAFTIHLHLETHEYLRAVEEAGVRILVHDQNETPLHQAGFVVPPGFYSYIEMGVQKVQNLPPPYDTKCGKIHLSYFPTYTRSKCHLEQLKNIVAKECKCRGLFMPDDKLPVCSLRQTVTCLYPALARQDKKAVEECPVDCSTTQYSHTQSYARFISNPMKGAARTPYITYDPRFANLSIEGLRREIRDNVVVITFFFQDLKVEDVKQSPSYDFYKLVGDVGGQLGLMLGASVLTLVEFIDLVAFILYHQMLRLSRRKKREKEDEAITAALKYKR